MERLIQSASSSDEEADLQANCLQGYGESSGSESDMPDIAVGDVCAGTAVDFV